MTQEVQPLTWQKRTNIEEHQQFFSKINEIIGNLAPTVDEAEQAIAQANAAIASANDAASTANAASAAASAAASQAQTAASTVTGYDGRLTAAEGDIDALQTADANNVKITGTHAIGNYAMLLTGNQDYDGIKRAIKTIVKKASIEGSALPADYWIDNHLIDVQGKTDNVPIISIGSERRSTGWETRINLMIYGSIDSGTKRQNNARIIFAFDEINKKIVMQVGYYDAASGNTTYNNQQTLLSW